MRSRLLQFTILLGCLLAANSALGNTCKTCYIDYENGNDSWDGTQKTLVGGTSGPWKHLPGMQGSGPDGSSHDGCSGNCAAQSPKAGDNYILKGGVVFPASTLPITWTWSGSSTTASVGYGCVGTGCIYIGVDPTWNKGKVNAVITTRDFGGCPASGVTATISAPGSGTPAAATPVMIGGTPQFADGSSFDVAYWTVTNQGSGYASNPTVTVSGSGCRNISAVADIQRAIIDMGAPSLDWTAKPPYNAPEVINESGSYVIVDNLELRNMQYSYAGISASGQFAPIGGSGNWTTFSNLYVHNDYPDTASSALHIGDSMSQITQYQETSEVSYSYVENGEVAFPCPGGQTICGWGDFGNIQGLHVHHNHIAYFLWAVKQANGIAAGAGNILDIFNNEVWAGISSNGTGHLNLFYVGIDGATHNIYNNLFYDNVGSTNQLTPGVNYTTTFNIYNNVGWNSGSGGSIFQPDLGASIPVSGAITTFNFWNNTLGATSNGSGYGSTFKGAVIGTGSCSGTGCSQRYVNLYNNVIISDQSGAHWFLMNNTIGKVNGVSNPTNTTADSVNMAMSLPGANSGSYTIARMFRPTSINSPTVFAAMNPSLAIPSYSYTTAIQGTNFNSYCATPGLAALCYDFFGNPRLTTPPTTPNAPLTPLTSGPWPIGPFSFTGKPDAPSQLTSAVK
jgi:hypothetical protein